MSRRHTWDEDQRPRWPRRPWPGRNRRTSSPSAPRPGSAELHRLAARAHDRAAAALDEQGGALPPPIDSRRRATPAVMRAAAQVHQPAGSREQGGEQVRRDDVDRHDGRTAPDAGVVDDRVERRCVVELGGDPPYVIAVGEVPITMSAPRSPSASRAAARSRLRACTTTSCPTEDSDSAARRPSPSAEPVTRIRLTCARPLAPSGGSPDPPAQVGTPGGGPPRRRRNAGERPRLRHRHPSR